MLAPPPQPQPQPPQPQPPQPHAEAPQPLLPPHPPQPSPQVPQLLLPPQPPQPSPQPAQPPHAPQPAPQPSPQAPQAPHAPHAAHPSPQAPHPESPLVVPLQPTPTNPRVTNATTNTPKPTLVMKISSLWSCILRHLGRGVSEPLAHLGHEGPKSGPGPRPSHRRPGVEAPPRPASECTSRGYCGCVRSAGSGIVDHCRVPTATGVPGPAAAAPHTHRANFWKAGFQARDGSRRRPKSTKGAPSVRRLRRSGTSGPNRPRGAE